MHGQINQPIIVCCLLSSGFRGLVLDSIAACLATLLHGSLNTTLVVGRALGRSYQYHQCAQRQGPPDALLRSLQSKWGLLLSSLHAALSVLLASLSLSDSVSLRTDRSISVCTCLGTRPRTQDISRLCTCKGRPTSSSIERVGKKKRNGARHKAVKKMVPRQAFPGRKNFNPINSIIFVLFDKYCPILDQLDSKDSSRDFQLNCVISYFFYLHLLLHTWVQILM
jgi:hypothetical protein